jgi:hypothetical protein
MTGDDGDDDAADERGAGVVERCKTGATEVLGVVVDAVLDAL